MRRTLFALVLLCCTTTPVQAQTIDDVVNWTYAYAEYYELPSEAADDLLRIGYCESRNNIYAIGRLGEVGFYQFHPRGIWNSTPQAKAGYSIYDIEAQVAAAVWVYKQGWAYTTLGWYYCSWNG